MGSTHTTSVIDRSIAIDVLGTPALDNLYIWTECNGSNLAWYEHLFTCQTRHHSIIWSLTNQLFSEFLCQCCIMFYIASRQSPDKNRKRQERENFARDISFRSLTGRPHSRAFQMVRLSERPFVFLLLSLTLLSLSCAESHVINKPPSTIYWLPSANLFIKT